MNINLKLLSYDKFEEIISKKTDRKLVLEKKFEEKTSFLTSSLYTTTYNKKCFVLLNFISKASLDFFITSQFI